MNKSRLEELKNNPEPSNRDVLEIASEMYLWLSKFKSDYLSEKFLGVEESIGEINKRIAQIEQSVSSPIYSAIMDEEEEEEEMAGNIKMQFYVPEHRAAEIKNKIEVMLAEIGVNESEDEE